MNKPSKKHPGSNTKNEPAVQANNSESNRIIIGTIGAALLSVALPVGFLMPFLSAAALAPFFHRAMKRGDVRTAFGFALRWGVILFVCITLLAVYLPGRTAGSVPGAGRCITIVSAWIRGAETATPFGPVSIAAGLACAAIVSVVSGGVGAIIIAAGTLGCAACTFTFLARHGDNVLSMAIIGNPPWIIAFCLAGLFLLIPTALPFYRKFGGTAPLESSEGAYVRTRAIIGIVLALAGIAFALGMGGAWRHLLINSTVW